MRKLTVFALLFLLAVSAFSQTPDPAKIPHYFGPYPNWANSPLTTVDANVQFGLTTPCGGTGLTAVASVDAKGAITAITVTNQGTGYTCAPDVTIASAYGSGASAHAIYSPSAGYISAVNLTNAGSNYFSPVVTITGDGAGATAEATSDPYSGAITGITITNPGSGYTAAAVDISDAGGTGSGASASAAVSAAVISVVVDSAGTGYRTPGGIRKFVDTLPGLGPNAANNLGQYISVAHPDTITYPGSDYYEIALVEYSRKMHSDLPPTKIRGYIQLNKGTDGSGQNTITPDPNPQFLGATIVATKDRPVRILFRNQLPTGAPGNLFLPVDTTLMGAGMGPDMGGMKESDDQSVYDGVRNPMCGNPGPKPMGCYAENRATLHLHGGTTPWISDGTPHQWTAPLGESTSYPKGVSVSYVPDMWYDASGNTVAECAGQTTCSVVGATNSPGDGALTFYYTNQQSARLLFYHDHAWGLTRLNVYAGEAAGYLITDNTEQKLTAPGGPLDASDPALGLGVPLVIQDRTFVPSEAQLAIQDPTWDSARWGGIGNFWYHHVYMPAQNPADPTGVSPYGRWMYGPWFWPPANADTTPYQPIANPYYDPTCNPATAPNGFCEPPKIPGTPNISVGMEQFNDTPLVNGTVYPTVTVDPKAYRFRILNAANDRFFNLQWYVADSNGTEVALKASEVAAALVDPNVFPTPDTTISPAGPSWLQIGSEGGFLPTPVAIPNQPITWITDPTRFDFGNVDQHAMLVAPAERADVVVDFSKYAGKTLILYNDAPAAFPARQASYDYYTGDPDNTDIGGAPSTVPGFGPNTRTIMQVKVNASLTTGPSKFSLSGLISAFAHNANGTGVFESGQHPTIVGQAGYNRAYGTKFTSSGDCSVAGTTTPCDGFARINQQGGDPFTFDTLSGSKLSLTLQPKALHDEMNASTFDEYGRMTANLGVEAVPATAGAQNVVLYPYVNPATEVIDATKLPSGGVRIAPIATNDDGTQIWKITHNGVDTHPIHFHLYDVQVINRVTWDNIIIPPDLNELGWKDTVRVSPLEDTYVALRPVVPTLPFQLPNSIRPLNPMVPLGMSMGFNSIGPDGQATTSTITNDLVNFGWEYVWHCHILSHEEMDMMRPVSLAVPPSAPANLIANSTGSGVILSWTDTSKNATSFTVQRATDSAFMNVTEFAAGNLTTYTDSTASAATTYYYRVYASNTVGSTKESGFSQSPGGGSFPTMTVDSGFSNTSTVVATSPEVAVAPTALDFGNVLVNTTAGPSSVTVSNVGGQSLTISSISLIGINAADFALPTSANPCTGATLTGGASCTVNVTFTSATLGTRSAAISIATNDPANPIVNVPLTGFGTATTAMMMNAPAITYGQNGVVTVSLSSTQITPVAGTVTLSVDGGASISQTLANGSANFTLTTPSAANHSLAAGYAPQGGVGAASATGTLVVSPAALNITASSASLAYGASVPAITPTYSGFVLGQGPANLTGTVVCSTTATSTSAPGTYPSSCSGAMSTNYAISYVPGTVTITKATTTTTITSNMPNPSIRGQIVTANFNIVPQYSGVVPTGTVTILASTGESCAATLPATSCNLIFSTSGSRTLTATYSGDSNFLGSTSPAATQQVVSSVTLSSSSLLFGNQVVGTTSASQAVTLANVGTTTLTINSIVIGGANPADFVQSNNCGGTLRVGQNCRINVSFRPIGAGLRTATLSVNDSDVTSPQTLSLTGMGVQPVASLTPTSYDFGAVLRRQTGSFGFTLSNSGTAPLTINRISLGGANSNQYTQRNNCGTTLGAGLSCTITVTFAPSQRGTLNATLSVSDNAPGSPRTATLTGVGQ